MPGHPASMLCRQARRGRRGVSHDIQMVNKLPVPMLAMRDCTGVLRHEAVPGALGTEEQVGQ